MAIRGKGRKEVEGVCVQVGKGTCDMNWGVVSTAETSKGQVVSWRQVDSGSSVASQSSLPWRPHLKKPRGYFGIANLFLMH